VILGPFVVIFVSSVHHQEDEIVRFVKPLASLGRQVQEEAHFSIRARRSFFTPKPDSALLPSAVSVHSRRGTSGAWCGHSVAKEFLDFPQILSQLVEQDRGCEVAQSVRGDLPHPEGSYRPRGAPN
jgi:hypothetical protein